MTRHIVAAALLLLAALPAPAAAEWQFTPMLGGTFLGNTTLLDPEKGAAKPHRTFGGAVSLLGAGLLGAEVLGVYSPGFFEGDPVMVDGGPFEFFESTRTYALMGNVVLTTPRRWTEYSLRPFVSGGFGLMNVKQTAVSDPLPVASNFSGYNIGGGAVGFLTARTGVRFDVRYFRTARTLGGVDVPSFGPPHLRYMTATIGVVIRR